MSAVIIDRYKAGYESADFLVRHGDIVAFVGYAAATLTVLGGLIVAFGGLDVTSEGNRWFGLCLVLAGGVIAGSSFVAGAAMAARGHLLRASLDGAVAESPFLTTDQKKVAMGLVIVSVPVAGAVEVPV